MSSCIRRYSQIPEGVRFFTTIPGDIFGEGQGGRLTPFFYFGNIPLSERLEAVTVPYTRTGNVIETATAEDMRTLYCGGGSGGVAGYGYIQLYNPTSPRTFLLKDLGQTVQFKVNGLLAIQWTLVQVISGPRNVDTGEIIWEGSESTEGVPTNYPAGGEGWVVTYLESSPNNPGTSYYQDTVGVMRVG